MYLFKLNPFYLYLNTFSTFNNNINENNIQDFWKVVRGLKSHSNGGVRRNNEKGNYSGLLGYAETFFSQMGWEISYHSAS